MKHKEIENLVRQSFGLEPVQEETEPWKNDRSDCYWFDEFQDGPAMHRECRLRHKCLCKDCPGYITREQADRIVWKVQAERLGV